MTNNNAAAVPGNGHKNDFALVCASHTPLLMREELASPEIMDSVRASLDRMGSFVRDFAPDQIIQFSPDHFHGFNYALMPSFCVGANARSWGDWGTATGPLNVDEAGALSLLEAVRDADIDAAVSFDMVVDHGFVQIWEAALGAFATLPIIPIFVNAVAYPIPHYRRARALGAAVGRHAARTGKRILFAASGGLSHDPIVPQIRGAAPELRARLVSRIDATPEQQARREQLVHEAGAQAMRGEGPVRPLNPAWDQDFLDRIARRDWAAIDALDPAEVDRVAGSGGNEVLTWVAAAAATDAAAGGYTVAQQDYQPIPGWIAGMGVFAALGGQRPAGA